MATRRSFTRAPHEHAIIIVDEHALTISFKVANGRQEGEYELPFADLASLEEKEYEAMTTIQEAGFVLGEVTEL